MTNHQVGSNPSSRPASAGPRTTIQGHVIRTTPEVMKHLRRLSSITISHLFRQAQEQGSATLNINDAVFTLYRHPDHTFTVEPGSPHRFSL